MPISLRLQNTAIVTPLNELGTLSWHFFELENLVHTLLKKYLSCKDQNSNFPLQKMKQNSDPRCCNIRVHSKINICLFQVIVYSHIKEAPRIVLTFVIYLSFLDFPKITHIFTMYSCMCICFNSILLLSFKRTNSKPDIGKKKHKN